MCVTVSWKCHVEAETGREAETTTNTSAAWQPRAPSTTFHDLEKYLVRDRDFCARKWDTLNRMVQSQSHSGRTLARVRLILMVMVMTINTMVVVMGDLRRSSAVPVLLFGEVRLRILHDARGGQPWVHCHPPFSRGAAFAAETLEKLCRKGTSITQYWTSSSGFSSKVPDVCQGCSH